MSNTDPAPNASPLAALIERADLAGAKAFAEDRVRAKPGDAAARVALFQIDAIEGRWERALNQARIAADLDPQQTWLKPLVEQAIPCELVRCAVFEGKSSPSFFGEPPSWAALLCEAVRVLALGYTDQFLAMHDRVLAAADATPGVIAGKAFGDIADTDARLTPVLEAFIGGKYFWVPWTRVRALHIEPPKTLWNAVWTVATATWSNGGELPIMIPTRYPGAESAADPELKLARRTDWEPLAPGVFRASGQRVFAADEADHALMDLRELAFPTHVVPGPADAGSQTPGGPVAA